MTTSAPPAQERLKASPLARKIARERNIEIARITGTGPHGRIIEADVLSFAERTPAPKPPVLPSAPARTPVAPPVGAQVKDLSQMRRVIARRMSDSKTTLPHFYVTAEIDMGEALTLREKLNGYDETLPKISVNDLIVKAVAKSLLKFPEVNSVYQDDKVYTPQGAHVGIAVALDDGLIVPVVRDADTLPLRKVASVARELIQKARQKKLQPSEYSGGSFTVSNLGAFDVENFLAIIDPAQGAILAVATVVKKPVVLADDTIAVRQRMNVTLSADHRVIDGATGAKFLQELKRLLQNPLSLLE
jgi:pyruvate dehydrogenase E2 component (dihydrolipoamide acetyltransferase)